MWWLAIKTFFGDKLTSSAGIFIAIFVVIFGVFIFSNSNVILSKFGFETTTNLKSQVTRLEGELKTAKRINDELSRDMETLTTRHKAELKALVEVQKEREQVKEKIVEIKTKKDIKDKPTIKKLNEKTVETPTEITLPLAEYNELSASNIDSLHEVFESFFPSPQEIK